MSTPHFDNFAASWGYQRPPRRSRRGVLRLRRILLLIPVCAAVLLGYVLVRLGPEMREQRAVEAIKSLGGHVVYGPPFVADVTATPPAQPRPSWFQSALDAMLGEYFFYDVVEVNYPPGTHNEDLRYLDDLPHLTSIDVNGSAISSAGLLHIRKKRKLRSLHLRSTGITDEDIEALKVLSDLRELDVSHTAITKQAVQVLKRFSRLEYLELEGTHIAPEDAQVFDDAIFPNYGSGVTWAAAPSEQLRQVAVALERQGARIDIHQKRRDNEVEYKATIFQRRFEEFLDLLEKLTDLKRLILVEVGVSHSHWPRIARFTRLEWLIIRSVPVTDRDMPFIGKLTNLRALRLEDAEVTDAGLAHLQSLNQLEELYLSELQLTDVALPYIARLKELKKLMLSDTELSDAGLVYLRQLKRLEELWLRETPITNEALMHLASLTKLKFLDLGGTKISDEGLVHLKDLSNLWYLNLSNTCITDAGLAHLSSLEKLTHVEAEGTNVSDAALGRLLLSKTEWFRAEDGDLD